MISRPRSDDRGTTWNYWEHRTPPALNDLLWEQAPGRQNANFRLDVRKAWVYAVTNKHAVPVIKCSAAQERVVDLVKELYVRLRALEATA